MMSLVCESHESMLSCRYALSVMSKDFHPQDSYIFDRLFSSCTYPSVTRYYNSCYRVLLAYDRADQVEVEVGHRLLRVDDFQSLDNSSLKGFLCNNDVF